MVRPPDLADVRRIGFFSPLAEDDAGRVARRLIARRYGSREFIIVEGERPAGFYVLRSGKARIFRTAPDGREQTFRLVSPGDTFAEVPVFDEGPNPATVEAIEESEAILVPTAVLDDVMREHPEVAHLILRHFSARLRSFTELVEQISLQTVQGRIARYLYQLAREEGVRTTEGIVVPREITQQDLASLVGSVREVVSRTLKVMEEDGIVQVRRKDIVICDVRALSQLL
ncbi:Crp/Fnr family transcriptional regulator [bacterium]|nr:MAG: Crp/Fnr family transcriptional regulator [bacterium]MCL4231062.1 Crp/Fnr family transcriptional regulator [Dehalococcoidia bacterium]